MMNYPQFTTYNFNYLSKLKKAVIYYNLFFYIFAILIAAMTLTNTILAFLVSSNVFDTTINRNINIAIGIMGILITTLHSILNAAGFDAKRDNFKLVHDLYNGITMETYNIQTMDLLKKSTKYNLPTLFV